MKYILRYWPALLFIAGILIGLLSGNSGRLERKELKEKYQEEQNQILEVIGQKDAEIVRLNEASGAIRERMQSDSAFFAHALNENKRAYSALKKKYNEINLNRASVADLDSLVSVLYGRR